MSQEDFIYVADSKLCSLETLAGIHEQGGKFITVMPRTYQEVTQFLQRVREGEKLEWQHTQRSTHRRKNREAITYRIHAGEACRAGYRLLWIHSSTKERVRNNFGSSNQKSFSHTPLGSVTLPI